MSYEDGIAAPGWIKVKCTACNGTGRLPRSEGFYTLGSNRRRKPSCHHCHGDGYTVMREKVEEPDTSDIPEADEEWFKHAQLRRKP